jgi:hypothetical protein
MSSTLFEEHTMEQHIKPAFESAAFESGTTDVVAERASAADREWLIDQALMDTFPASDPVSLYSVD